MIRQNTLPSKRVLRSQMLTNAEKPILPLGTHPLGVTTTPSISGLLFDDMFNDERSSRQK